MITIIIQLVVLKKVFIRNEWQFTPEIKKSHTGISTRKNIIYVIGSTDPFKKNE